MKKLKFAFIAALILLPSIYWGLFDSQLDKYYPLNPQYGGQSVIILSNPPLNTKPEIRIKYVSEKCTTMHFNSNLVPTGQDKWSKKIEWKISSKEKNKFETIIPINGGGWCKWKLSNIMIGLSYYKNKINENVILDTGKFLNIHINDEENNKKNNYSDTIEYTSQIYSVYKEIHDEYTRVFFISPYGEGEPSIWLKKDKNGYIYYNPKLDESKITKVFVSKENSWVKYPNGEIEYGTDSVSYYKIQDNTPLKKDNN
jgi:hypothetical protein